MESSDSRPFGELPGALVDEILGRTSDLGQKLLSEFEEMQAHRQKWREDLREAGLLCREADLLSFLPHIPTTCAVDGSYVVERLLTSDLVAGAAVAVEGLTPPSETRYWPEPRHEVWIQYEPHESEAGILLRALVIGMELHLAAQAPHQVVFLDGSLTTPLIYFNQAFNKSQIVPHLKTTKEFIRRAADFLEYYRTILSASRSDRAWVAVPKYTTRREIGCRLRWPVRHDDRGLLTFILEAGEYTKPVPLQEPDEPWHLNTTTLNLESLANRIVTLLGEIQVVYYRPSPGMPAVRLEVSRSITETPARLAGVLQGVRHQCGAPGLMEPYPLYMADRMVKHLASGIAACRQVTTQHVARHYQGRLDDIFLGLHSYRTESIQ